MSYQISFAGGDDVEAAGRIFEMDGMIFLCAGGLSVKVPAKMYHDQMRRWIENRMPAPLVFTGDNRTRCTMNAPAGHGDVVVELKLATG